MHSECLVSLFPDELDHHPRWKVLNAEVAEHVDDLGLGVVRVEANMDQPFVAATCERFVAADRRSAARDDVVERSFGNSCEELLPTGFLGVPLFAKLTERLDGVLALLVTGKLAAHVAGARTYWVCGVFKQPGAETTPFPDPLHAFGWEDDPDHPRSGDELRWALDSTWAVIRDCLARWTADELDRTESRKTFDGSIHAMTRGSMLNRLVSHDAFHGGEISQLLGLHDLPPIDLWRRHPPS